MNASGSAPPPWRRWQCFFCAYVYDEAAGAPDHGLIAGTRWEDVPDDWMCPNCGATKADFQLLEPGE